MLNIKQESCDCVLVWFDDGIESGSSNCNTIPKRQQQNVY